MKTFREKLGMTLLELLIVIAMLVILVSIVLMATGRNTTAQKKDITASTLALLDSALQEYKDFVSDYPEMPSVEPIQSSEFLYYELNRVPGSRKVLQMLDTSMIRNTGGSSDMEICDSWGTPLNYIYDPDVDTFPLIVSAGPDKSFENVTDNITNRK